MGFTRRPCHGLSSGQGFGAAIRVSSAGETPMTEPLVVRRETQIAPPPATVFAFLTDPEKILNWMGRPLQRDDGGGALRRPRWEIPVPALSCRPRCDERPVLGSPDGWCGG